ncbi:MAG: tetratricopeptide repeat protein [Alphaproteobacteria bacterium]|nr:tetratricopeptide repeat protein [Alphaproteobacteria bacterium]
MPSLQYAIECHHQGRLEQAETLYRAVLADDPEQPDALALLGVLLSARGKFTEAIALLNRAIEKDPSTPLFRFHLGTVLSAMKEQDGAVRAFQEAVARKPDFVDAHLRLACLFEETGRLHDAIEHARTLTALRPDDSAFWVRLGSLLIRNKAYDEASAAAERALTLAPNDPGVLALQALALDVHNREEDAIRYLKRALAVRPDFLEAWDMLGVTYQKLGQRTQAEESLLKALGLVGFSREDEQGAFLPEEHYTVQHWNLALLELLHGDFRNGFAHYRARFKKAGRAQRPPVPPPLWNGEDLSDKKILVVGEQGLGDVLMLVRFLPLLKAKGAHVVLLAHDALVPLLRQTSLAETVISKVPEEQGDLDYQTSIFDLPFHLGTTIETLPSVPYLPSPEPDCATRLPASSKPRVGLVWAGKPSFGDDRRRSLPLSLFVPLLRENDAAFFSLMRDKRPGDDALLATLPITDLAPALTDFLATARLVAQMNLVVTCDTAVAHLAGGMGKPTWLLLPFAPDWRWLTDRDDSPWYPSMRLFRQKTKADWEDVILRVRKALAEKVV